MKNQPPIRILVLVVALALVVLAATSDQGVADKSYRSTAPEKNRIVSTRAGRVHHVLAFNNTGADMYLQIYDTNAIPADATTVDFAPLLVPNGSTGYYDFVNGHPFASGLTLVASTSSTNKTAIGTSNVWFTVSYQERGAN
jgi:hypothetical protein